MFRTLLTALTLAASLFLAACGGGVDDESFDKIKTGMSLKSVENILGAGELQDTGGTGISSAGLLTGNPASGNTKTYLWKDGDRSIIVEFKADEVINKRKLGFGG